jgi:DNA-directed RNA polymerase specialized sigma24 family protein
VEAKPPWWATDPELAEVLRRKDEEFRRELEACAPRPDSDDFAPPDAPAPIVAARLPGTSRRELAAARDALARARTRYAEAIQNARDDGLSWAEIAKVLGVSRQVLHR